MKPLPIFAAATAAVLLASPAFAETVMLQGSGLFSNNAPTSQYTAANANFSFSFNLDSPVPVASRDGTMLSSTAMTDFTYTLAGVAKQATLLFVVFDTNGFDLRLADGTELDFVGADLGGDGVLTAADWGSYSVLVHVPGRSSGPIPSIRTPQASALFAPTPAPAATDLQEVGMATVVTTIAGVPEPSAWALMIVGFGGAGVALRRGRRRSAVA